ncbi:hypothetical protein VTO73DRAFT_7035 [Trametes versicolor]
MGYYNIMVATTGETLRREHELREEAECKARQEQEALRRAQAEQERVFREAEKAARRARLEQERKAKEAEDAARRLREQWEREAAERERKRKEKEAADTATRERLERERMEREATEAAWRARLERERMEREAAAEAAAWRAYLEREHGHAFDSPEQRIKAFCDEYELKWAELKTNTGLTATVAFHEFPFPVLPSSLPHPEEITYERVREFMFHELRTSNQGKTHRAILKTEALRWHPDRFDALIRPKVQEDDWLAVKEAAESVARCVTGLLAEA